MQTAYAAVHCDMHIFTV